MKMSLSKREQDTLCCDTCSSRSAVEYCTRVRKWLCGRCSRKLQRTIDAEDAEHAASKGSTLSVEGVLEIDPARGVIYFHNKQGCTTLRICGLKLSKLSHVNPLMSIDITHMVGASVYKGT